MKREMIFSGLIALVVSLSSYGILKLIDKEKTTVRIEHIDAMPSKSAVYSIDHNGNAVPLDFHETASNVLEGVVHIKSTQLINQGSNTYNFRSIPDPFRDFFGPQMERQFYFPNGNKSGSKKMPNRVGSGSGVIISDDGYIVTNNHVVAESDDIEITLHDNRTYKAIVIGTDPSTDLALLKIKEEHLPTVPFTDSGDVKIGQWVMAVGNPMGLNSTVTAGIISAKGRNINILKDKYAVENFIQTDAAINPGNSGGALVNLNGGLIGINTAIASPTGSFAGYGFAVPSNIVEKVITDLMEYGTVQRGVLGVMIRTLDSNLANDKSIDISKGVYVDSLMANSAAGDAGIKVGDVIIKVNGEKVSTSPELQGAIAQYRPGEEVDIYIHRNGQEELKKVKLNSRDGLSSEMTKDQSQLMKILGAEFQDISAEDLKELGINSGVKIERIISGKIKRQTQMREGFIITHLNNEKVKNTSDFYDKIKDAQGGVIIEGIYPDIPGQYYYAIGL